MRGDTAQGGTKPATLETGVVVQVPLFLNEGDVVKVDTQDGDYSGAWRWRADGQRSSLGAARRRSEGDERRSS